MSIYPPFKAHEKNRYLAILSNARGRSVVSTCRKFGISKTAFYKWRKRYRELGVEGLHDQRRVLPEPTKKVPYQWESSILRLSRKHPEEGARRLKRRLEEEGIVLSVRTIERKLKAGGRAKRRHREGAFTEEEKQKRNEEFRRLREVFSSDLAWVPGL